MLFKILLTFLFCVCVQSTILIAITNIKLKFWLVQVTNCISKKGETGTTRDVAGLILSQSIN